MIEDTTLWIIIFEIALGNIATIGILTRKATRNEEKIANCEHCIETHEHRLEKIEDKLYA